MIYKIDVTNTVHPKRTATEIVKYKVVITIAFFMISRCLI